MGMPMTLLEVTTAEEVYLAVYSKKATLLG